MRIGRILCALAVCAGLAMPVAADEGLTLEVGDKITLKAEELFLRQVLVALSEAVPFTLVERGETLDQPVSFDFEASDWADDEPHIAAHANRQIHLLDGLIERDIETKKALA